MLSWIWLSSLPLSFHSTHCLLVERMVKLGVWEKWLHWKIWCEKVHFCFLFCCCWYHFQDLNCVTVLSSVLLLLFLCVCVCVCCCCFFGGWGVVYNEWFQLVAFDCLTSVFMSSGFGEAGKTLDQRLCSIWCDAHWLLYMGSLSWRQNGWGGLTCPHIS